MRISKWVVLAVYLCLIGAIGAEAQQTALRLIPLTPCRIADTRDPNGPFGGPSVAGNSPRSFVIPSSACGVPSTAAAYSLNVTAVPHGSLGYLTIWPTGQSQPLVSTLNATDGRVKANAAIVPAGTSGAVSVYVTNTADVILDINGYFVAATDPLGLAFFPVTPCRIADTRDPGGALGGPSLVGMQARSFPVLSSNCGIPSSALAYSLNFTAVPPSGLGFLSTWPAGVSQPVVSTLNAPAGAVTANAAIVPAGTNGAINVLASSGADVIIDANGYFALPGSASNPLSLFTLTPCRVLDTRDRSGLFVGNLADDTTANACGVPASAQAVVLNATVVPAEALSFLALWPDGLTQPLVSTLNSFDGLITSNMAIVPTSGGVIDAFATNHTQLVLDTSGYFSSITQTGLNTALNGRYAFTLQGFDGNGNLVTTAGSFVADGNGGISSGFEDRYAAGSSEGGALTGSYSVGADKRGTMTLTTSQGSHTFNFALGKLSSGIAGQGYVIESDAVPATGVIKKQDPSVFSTFGSTAASFAFGGKGQNGSGPSAVAGTATLNGNGTLSGMMDIVNTSQVGPSLTMAASYTVGDTTNGRGTMPFTSPGGFTMAFYIVSANEMFLIDSNPSGQGDSPLVLDALKQASSFPAPASGSVSVLSLEGRSPSCPQGQPGTGVEIDLMQWGAAGSANLAGDMNDCGVAGANPSVAIGYTVAGNGRVVTTGFTHPPVIYLVNSSEGFLVGTNVNKVQQGFFEAQASGSFSNASLTGSYFFGNRAPVVNGGDVGEGVVVANGNGGITGTNDFNSSGGLVADQTFSDTYSAAANGRVTTNETVLYIISTSKALLIDGAHSNFPKVSVIEK